MNNCHQEWLNIFYSKIHLDRIDHLIDDLFIYVDDLLISQDNNGLKYIIENFDINKLETNLMVALLSITLPVREWSERIILYNKIEDKILKFYPLDRVNKILNGLK